MTTDPPKTFGWRLYSGREHNWRLEVLRHDRNGLVALLYRSIVHFRCSLGLAAVLRREWLLVLAVTAVAVVVGLGVIRWIAPELLHRDASSLFFETVFRKADFESRPNFLQDRTTGLRGRPFPFDLGGLVGPHDVLGFRNPGVPRYADIVTIGDSQTYGVNESILENWPGYLERELKNKKPVVYNMAIGGWAAIQYLSMLGPASSFRPRVIVVAFYSGNDADETVAMAYRSPDWEHLRPLERVDLKDRLRFPGFPSPPEENWEAVFPDGTKTVFTPALRLVSNDSDYATVRAGYEIMARVARQFAQSAHEQGIRTVFTIIPTKELVYAPRVVRDGLSAPAAYRNLVAKEAVNLNRLAAAMRSNPNSFYVDVVGPLQQAALTGLEIYPSSANGHPIAEGYRVIAHALASQVSIHLRPIPPIGLVGIQDKSQPSQFLPLLVTREGYWLFESGDLIELNGWRKSDVVFVEARDLVGMSRLGIVGAVDPRRFGPAAVRLNRQTIKKY